MKKLLVFLAAIALLSACSQSPEETGNAKKWFPIIDSSGNPQANCYLKKKDSTGAVLQDAAGNELYIMDYPLNSKGEPLYESTGKPKTDPASDGEFLVKLSSEQVQLDPSIQAEMNSWVDSVNKEQLGAKYGIRVYDTKDHEVAYKLRPESSWVLTKD